MRSVVQARDEGVASFRTRLFTAIMVIVVTLTALGFYLAQRKVTADAERNLQENFQAEISSLHKLEQLRHAALAERCNVLAAKPRIHAAMEDNAIDLLYPSAKDDVGGLDPKTEAQLALSRLPDTQQIGYIRESTEADKGIIDEVIAVPIFSS